MNTWEKGIKPRAIVTWAMQVDMDANLIEWLREFPAHPDADYVRGEVTKLRIGNPELYRAAVAEVAERMGEERKP